jgi:hypothetical protein
MLVKLIRDRNNSACKKVCLPTNFFCKLRRKGRSQGD